MSSICLTSKVTRRGAERAPVDAFRGTLAISVLWIVNLTIILFGWPFLLYGKFKYRMR